MAGPSLEIFKFGLYLFVPVFALLHFGDPDWYHNHVLPYHSKLFPPDERLVKKLPTEPAGIREELERIKSERETRNVARKNAEASAKAVADAPPKSKWFGIF